MANLIRTIVVFDAPDLAAESNFWAKLLDGKVVAEETWHSLVDAEGNWIMGFQLSPNHKRPQWPNGEQQQQIHLDLHAEDPEQIHALVLASGGELLEDAKDSNAEQGFRVYADPAGHPFCVGWGHPTKAQLNDFLTKYFAN